MHDPAASMHASISVIYCARMATCATCTCIIIIHAVILVQGSREPSGPVDRQRARADAQVGIHIILCVHV